MSLKEKVLKQLMQANGEYCSGAMLADLFHVSRTAVWKAVEQLKGEGCCIEALTKKGYRLTNLSDLFCPQAFQDLVKDCRTGWQVRHLQVIDSTNNEAKRLASEGAAAGMVVLADRQTSGRGRMGKQFHSPAGGLYFSVILRPQLPLMDMMALTACTAAAVHQALMEFGIPTQIKWVNDLFLNGKKVCGILSEGEFSAELLRMEYMVVGIGINLRKDPDLPEELQSIVTDLFTETEKHVDRTRLLAAILRQLERYIDGLPERTYLPVYTQNSCTLGHHVRVMAERGLSTALAAGFSDDAGLIVVFPDGSREIIRTGTAQIID